MLKWALIFFLISVVAGLFGFTNLAAAVAAKTARTVDRFQSFFHTTWQRSAC